MTQKMWSVNNFNCRFQRLKWGIYIGNVCILPWCYYFTISKSYFCPMHINHYACSLFKGKDKWKFGMWLYTEILPFPSSVLMEQSECSERQQECLLWLTDWVPCNLLESHSRSYKTSLVSLYFCQYTSGLSVQCEPRQETWMFCVFCLCTFC